ncbi:MAG: hypothetical protein ACX93T_03100 [Bacteroidota bacterium]
MKRKWIKPQSIIVMHLGILLCALGGCSTPSNAPEKPLHRPLKKEAIADSGQVHMTSTTYTAPDEEKRTATSQRLASEKTKTRFKETGNATLRTNATIVPPQTFNEYDKARIEQVSSFTKPPKRTRDHLITQESVINNINYLARRAELGKQNVTADSDKNAITILGETGSGKSTAINYWMGRNMARRTPEEMEAMGILDKLEDVVVVDPNSAQPEAASIGHERVSHTFMPQIIQDPNNDTQIYIDCPGFFDNRGAEINIANAINIRQVLQQVRSVKAVCVVSYTRLGDGRGAHIQSLAHMCAQMFGGIDNLRRHQNSILLGINRAPAQTSIDSIRTWLAAMDSPAIQILSQRAFLYDPLEKGGTDFWSRDRFLNEIEQMPAIPQHVAPNMFQTVLTSDDKIMLQRIVSHQVSIMSTALEQEDYTAADRCWSLLNQLRVVEHSEIEELMKEQVRPHMRAYAEARTAAFSRHAAAHQFTEADQILDTLQALNRLFPNEHLVNLEGLQETLQIARTKQNAQQEAEERARREQTARDIARREREELEVQVRSKEEELEAMRRKNQR